ncbi:HNH endonuclease [Polaromonas hydrogenivorans]|uniref:HNH endonuclease n=1 Tax=Polaromonas hydrogenivorans TaxID=335476 RepID=A0AAU7LW37_9BURK
MIKIDYIDSIKTYIDEYDKTDHQIWNKTEGKIVEVRNTIRKHYLKEQSYCCAYCKIEKKETHGLTWDIEHILPKSLFPEYLFEPENLAIACKECNNPKDATNVLTNQSKKPIKYPSRSNDYSIVHPHFDKHHEHFEIIVIGKKRIYRILNEHKASQTYIACNLSRFDYKFAEWECFDSAIANEFSAFLDKCPPDANPAEIKRMLGHMKFVNK